MQRFALAVIIWPASANSASEPDIIPPAASTSIKLKIMKKEIRIFLSFPVVASGTCAWL
jgi:hypothetical protein